MGHFDTLLEHTLERFENYGINTHDYVKITKAESSGINGEYTEIVKNLQKSDLNLKVIEVIGPEDGVHSVTIGQEAAGGLFVNKVTVPINNVELVSRGVPPSIPQSWIGDTEKEIEEFKPKMVVDLISKRV